MKCVRLVSLQGGRNSSVIHDLAVPAELCASLQPRVSGASKTLRYQEKVSAALWPASTLKRLPFFRVKSI